jgi:long-chain acyl-CoA synthetase
MIIEEIISQNASSHPEKAALICGDITISYSDLWYKICNAAAYFSSLTEKGDRVILSASKSPDFVYCYFGAHLAGCICVPIDSETNVIRLERIVSQAKPKIILGELRNNVTYKVDAFPVFDNRKHDRVSFPAETDIADLLFTTGTTGLPKGVELSFKNQMAAANNINTFIGNTSDDTELLALPISHSFGLGRLRCVLVKGATLVLLGSFASMKKFYAEIERCHITGFGMVPASWAYIQKMSGDRIGNYSDQIKYIEIGSAFMPLENKRKLMELLPHTHICMHYGLTEASRSAFISFHDDTEYLNTMGKPAPNTDIDVFGENGMKVSDGEEGELCVKGDHVCSGYWGQTIESFGADFIDGYFKTGDWGFKDKSGYINMISRKKEIINVGGKKVSPIEVEEVLNQYPGITESACVGVHDDVLGEVVKAFVTGSTTTADDILIKKELMRCLENYKVPAYIEHIDEIPKTQNGKIQRLKLK